MYMLKVTLTSGATPIVPESISVQSKCPVSDARVRRSGAYL